MKYSKIVQHPDTKKFHVQISKKLMFGRAHDTETGAKVQARIESATWYMIQANEMLDGINKDELEESSYSNINSHVTVMKDWVEDANEKQSNYDQFDPCTWA